MIDSLLIASNSKSDRMVALVAVHKDRHGHMLAHLEPIFDTAPHPERVEEADGGHDVLLTDNAMSQTAGTGLEATVHSAARMKGLAELNVGTMKNLERIAIWG